MASIAQPAAQESTSVWGHIQNFGKTVGHGFVVVGEKIGEGATKVYEYVKPFFQMIAKFFAEQFENLRDFLKEHKTEAIIGLVTFGLGIILMGLFHAMCCSGSRPDAKPAGTKA